MAKLREAFPEIPVFGISAVSGQGVREMLFAVYQELQKLPKETMVFEPEFEYEFDSDSELPFVVEKIENGVYSVEGPRVEKMLGYTNLESEKGFVFFQDFLKKTGILDELEAAGIQEGDTVKMYGWSFDYYK